MPQISIGQSEFIKGASTSDFLADGGYSPEDRGHNLFVKKGLLYPQPVLTDNGASEEIVAWSSTTQGIGSDSIAVGSNSTEDGKFYTLNSDNTLTLVASDASRNYRDGMTDAAYYNGKFYVTSTTDIAELIPALTTQDFTWLTVTKGGAALNQYLPHPILIFADKMYVANGSKFVSYDKTTVDEAALPIDPDYYITSVAEYQNKIYIAAEPYYNASGTLHGAAKLFIYDIAQSTTNYIASYTLRDRVDLLFVFNGSLLVFTSKYLAYWNGINIIRLWDIDNSGYQVFKRQVFQYSDRLYFANYKDITCFDGKAFSYFLTSDTVIYAIYCINGTTFHVNTNSKIYSGSLITGAGSCYWRSNRYHFGGNVRLKKLLVELGEDLASGGDMEFYFYDHKGVSQLIGSMTYAAGDRLFKEFTNINITTANCQLRVRFKTNAKPIRQLSLEYERTDAPIRK